MYPGKNGHEIPRAAAQTDILIPRKKAATLLGLSAKTLANWTSTHRYSLPYCKLGSRVMYRLSDIEEFIAKSRVVPTSLD